MARDVCPSADLNESLGAANQRWKKVYVGEVVEEESNFISRLVTKLASKAAISVSSLSNESIFYRLLSYAMDASGVEYNFNNANAWYICFGDLLGGLIIQGGCLVNNQTVTLPIAYSDRHYSANITHLGTNASTTFIIDSDTNTWTASSFKVLRNNNSGFNYFWLTLGY